MKIAVIVLLLIVSGGPLFATPILNICLTGSTEGIIPTYGEAFKNGAEMAIAPTGKATHFTPQIKTYFYEATPLASARATKKMVEDKCAVIIGYSTMNELLAAQQVLRDTPVPVISIYGEVDERFRETPFIMTLEPPIAYLVDQFKPTLKSLLPARPGAKALLLTAVDQEGPVKYKAIYAKWLTENGFAVDTFDFLERTLDVEILRRERGTSIPNYQAIFLLSRSVNASNLSDILVELGAKPNAPVLIATKNLGSSQLPAYLDRLKHKDVSVYFPRYNCTTDANAGYQDFVRRYRARYSREPMIVSADTYDALNYVLTSAKRLPQSSEKVISAKALQRAMKLTKFKGITRTEFGENFRISYSGHFVIHVTKNGYRDVTGHAGRAAR